jgi:hypothetical protein
VPGLVDQQHDRHHADRHQQHSDGQTGQIPDDTPRFAARAGRLRRMRETGGIPDFGPGGDEEAVADEARVPETGEHALTQVRWRGHDRQERVSTRGFALLVRAGAAVALAGVPQESHAECRGQLAPALLEQGDAALAAVRSEVGESFGGQRRAELVFGPFQEFGDVSGVQAGDGRYLGGPQVVPAGEVEYLGVERVESGNRPPGQGPGVHVVLVVAGDGDVGAHSPGG